MLQLVKKLNEILDKKQKGNMVGLVVMMLISAVLETASISIVIPVVTVVMDQNAIEKNKFVRLIYDMLGCQSTRSFTVIIMLSMVVAFALKNIFLFIQQRALYRFIYTNQFNTSMKVMKRYMNRSYEYYLYADTANIQRNITSDVNNMYALVMSLLTIASEVIVFVFLAAVLIIADPKLTIMISILLVLTLLIIKLLLEPILKKTGEENREHYSDLFKWISQIVAGIKEVKIGNSEKYFINEYEKCGRGYVGAVRTFTLLSNVPRLFIETVCVIGMILYLLFIVLSGQSAVGMMSTIAAFGMAVVRLMPCANRINNQLNNIAYYQPAFLAVADSLKAEIDAKNLGIEEFEPAIEKLDVKKCIELKNICYKYPNTDKWIFDKADLTIPVGKSIGIVGTSGSGKSTIVDLLLGLLTINDGKITADGVDILDSNNYRKWLKNVGYIPQTIFMLDDTLRNNICFGIPSDEIDEERLWEVIKEAQLDEFINSLPEGLDTSIGERGIRISGGQRQRVGIARALYGNPEVLILDEATSALDNDTESAIMESINRLHGLKTLIIVAHRLQTIEKCDEVYRVNEGKIIKER